MNPPADPPAHGDPEDDRTVIRPLPAQAAPAPASAAVGAAAAGHEGGLPMGVRLGEFEITRLIGEGGFGIVYEAWDHSLHRRVAVKEYMPSSLAARGAGQQVQVKSARHGETFEAGLKSFINEARLLASFDHPALMKVYRFWEANGTAYMAMPLLQGSTLKDVLRSLPEPPDEAWLLALLDPLTEALQVIHAEQCFHRDIAPDNIMLLQPSGRWLLLDFGAARRVIGDMTQALTVILKPGYAPVEQYAETPGMKQGPWTDVYALAAVIYSAIVGRTPPASVSRLLNDSYVPLVQSAAGRYSDGFLAAIDRALLVRPEQRTASIEEFRQALGLGPARVGNAGPPAASGAAPYVAAAAPARPQPAAARPAAPVAAAAGGMAWKLGAAAAALAALGIGGWMLWQPAGTPATAPEAGPATPAAPAVAQASAAATTPAAAAAPASAAAGALDVPAEFDRALHAAAPGLEVQAQALKSTLHIGRDEYQFSVQSPADGYLYVLAYASDGSLALVVPNGLSGAVRLRKGQPWRFPTGNGFVLETQEPAGHTHMLVLVSKWQRNFDALRPSTENSVRVFPNDAALARLARSHAGPGTALVGTPICPSGAPCDDAFGATILRFETVR